VSRAAMARAAFTLKRMTSATGSAVYRILRLGLDL
jgi:hypothetical protein